MKLRRLTRLATSTAVTTLAAGTFVVAFSATGAFAAAAATASPNTGLHDKDTTTVSGTGFPANKPIQIEECVGTTANPPPDNSVCDGNSLDSSATSTSAGAFTNSAYVVYTLGVAGSQFPNSPIRCDSSHSCVLYVGVDQNNFSAAHTFVDITFAAPPATPNAPVAKSGTNGTNTPYPTLNYSAGGASTTFNPAANFQATDSNGAAETINKPTVTPVGTVVGSLVCASGTSCTYTGAGGTTTAYTDQFSLSFTATTTGTPPATSSAASFSPFQFTVSAKPSVVTSVNGVDETSTPANQVEPAGATSFPVVSVAGFNVGDYIIIDPGVASAGPNPPAGTLIAERLKITGINGTTLTFTPALKYTHDATVVDQTGSSVSQFVTLPLTAGGITMSEAGGATPSATLNDPNAQVFAGETCSTSNTLTGQPFFACGTVQPVTVSNMRGTDAAWSVTGQVTDFQDAQYVGTNGSPTCDTIATFNNHCIPGGNLQWAPVAAVTQPLAPGDVANVTAGPSLANIAISPSIAGNTAKYALSHYGITTPAATATAAGTVGTAVSAGWSSGGTFGVVPASGLTNGGVTLCQTSSGTAGGTFACGANLSLAVPASAAATSTYTATLTLTLS